MKVAEIASLRSQVGEKSKLVTELEKKLKEAQDQLAKGGDGATASLTAKVKELEAALAKAGSGGVDPAAKQKFDEMKADRDKLKEKLQEYEVIEDDIANLKRLQKENEDLKKALADVSKGGAAPAAAAPKPAPAPAPAAPASAGIGAPPDMMAAAVSGAPAPTAVPKGPNVDPLNVQAEGSDKSAEDLLSEFEKMLG